MNTPASGGESSAELLRPEVSAPVHELVHESSSAQWLARYQHSLMGVFGTPQRVLVRGAGALVWDADGKEYLDLLGGVAVNALGHAHPFVTSVITSQLATLGHVSNFFTSPTQVALAEKLLQITQAPEGSTAFFTNSGTEANEAAFKIARVWGNQNAKPRILALEGAFHGRSMGALALTAKEAYRKPFEPLPPGVEHLPFGDLNALREALASQDVAALFVEPIQGEVGVRPLPTGYLKAARELTRQAGALLIVDEVQTGIGRTGQWLATPEIYGSGFSPAELPDVVTLAKGLGSGFPIGALIAVGSNISGLLGPGSHGTTFGGNPAATAAALATLHTIESTGLLGQVRTRGEALRKALADVEHVTEVRGSGLLIGFDLDLPIAAAMVQAALDAGFIINSPGPQTIRLAPPLILSQEQSDSFITALPKIIGAAQTPGESGTK
ncbi:acetylornithine aminotransferase [Psychromicrobium silvestre]|uniref:Acetylornithine aminotransferase n=1 Tax=Psychromicrobium silvestre TaxID=1645614 RepID=A0A7Y9LQM5_9MICC|nr:acetylornithine transaminase [Psychromicrobium silvestre]NYE93806.1 acetylornithine aminotransferase [Psychromicrobium silvestre]